MKPLSGHERPRTAANLPKGSIDRRLFVVLGAILAVIGLYAVAGTFAGPWLVDRALDRYAAAGTGRSAAHGTIRFNPFTLVADMAAVELRDESTGIDFAAERVVADFAAATLIVRRPLISRMAVDRPRLDVRAGALPALHRAARAALGRARFDSLEIAEGVVTAAGWNGDVTVERVAVSLAGFDGDSGSDGRFALDGSTTAGTGVSASGTLASTLERIDGELQLTGLGLTGIEALLPGGAAAASVGGQLDLDATFAVTSPASTPALELFDATLALAAVSITPAAGWSVTADRAAASADIVLTSVPDRPRLTGRVELADAELRFSDARLSPAQSFVLDEALALATADTEGFSVTLRGGLRGAGSAALTVNGTDDANGRRRISLEGDGLSAATLSAYATDMLGRPLAGGTLDVDLDYAVAGERIDGSIGIVAQALELAAVPARERRNEPIASLDLATALLENADGIIELELPFGRSTGTVRQAISSALSARLTALTATPFDSLAPLSGDADIEGAVPFLPGDPALHELAHASIDRLADILVARPRLGLRVHGGYDAAVDRDALARQQIELHVQLATAGPVGQARPAPVDVDSTRVRDVLDEFAGERLPEERVAALAERHTCEGALVPICEHAYYEQIFDALVANETIAPAALSRLGRFRAQSVIDELRQRGIDNARLTLVPDGTTVETAFGVGLPVELTAMTAAAPAGALSDTP